ncbi:MAG: hypothetical protein JXQ93_04790 [Flavobacteriaceae bacterium]
MALFMVLLFLLSFAILLNSIKVDNSLSLIETTENTYTKPLPSDYANQYIQAYEKDSSLVFSPAFYKLNHQRKLVLVSKEPSKRSILNQIIVWVFPEDKDKFVNSKNYNEKGYLDFSSSINTVMYHFKGENYGVREINLPFIDIKKIFVIQHGIWKETLYPPFKKLDKDTAFESNQCSGSVYEPLLFSILEKYGIDYINYDELSNASFKEYFKDKGEPSMIVNNPRGFWKSLSKRDTTINKYMKLYNFKENESISLLEDLINKNTLIGTIFDLEKLSYYFSIMNLFSNNDAKKIAFVINAKTNLLEPIFIQELRLGVLNTYVKDERISSIDFLSNYAENLNEIGHLNLTSFIQQSSKLKKRILCRNQTEPGDLFNARILEHNQLVLKMAVNPQVQIKVEFLSLDDRFIKITVENLGMFPVSMSGIEYKGKKIADFKISRQIIAGGVKDTVKLDLPKSFQNLFVHKKTKTTGFVFEKDIFNLSMLYQILGIKTLKKTEIVPYQPLQNYTKDGDLFRKKTRLMNNEFLKINEPKREIYITKNFSLKKPLIFPKNYTVVLGAGIKIDIRKGGKIISYSPVRFVGTKDRPIKINSSDKQGQGLLVLSEGSPSTLKHVSFNNLTNLSHDMWSTTSAITFYESPVNIDYVRIANNTCEDALNIVRTNFTMTNTYFLNTQSDAFDGDFVQGRINSCMFQNLGNDAIDISGSDLDISNVKIINAGDKALSAGEDSKMKVNKVVVSNSAIALAGKDLSIVDARDLRIYNTKLGFTAFQKKPEFGPSNITAKDVKMDSVQTKYLIENTSSLMLDGVKVKTKQADVKSMMYGVKYGVSSEKTRNKSN